MNIAICEEKRKMFIIIVYPPMTILLGLAQVIRKITMSHRGIHPQLPYIHNYIHMYAHVRVHIHKHNEDTKHNTVIVFYL